MKQTMDNLSSYGLSSMSPFESVLSKFLSESNMRFVKNDEFIKVYMEAHYRDIAVMNALTSKAGLPYIAKLAALTLEGGV